MLSSVHVHVQNVITELSIKMLNNSAMCTSNRIKMFLPRRICKYDRSMIYHTNVSSNFPDLWYFIAVQFALQLFMVSIFHLVIFIIFRGIQAYIVNQPLNMTPLMCVDVKQEWFLSEPSRLLHFIS